MNRFKELRGNPIRSSNSYCFPKSDERDEVDAPRNKQGTSIRYKNFDKRQDFKSIKKHLGSRLFEDEKFPASNRLLSDNGQGQIIHYFGGRRVMANEIKWLRPHVGLKNVLELTLALH